VPALAKALERKQQVRASSGLSLPRLDRSALYRVVIAPAGHRLVRARAVSWEELAHVPWVLTMKPSLARVFVEDSFRRHGLMPATPRHTHRAPGELVARVAPAFGVATVEHVAINAVIAGCDPAYLPVLIAATEAVAASEFNLQSIQATTHPAAVWLIVNGPIVHRLRINAGANCLGQGSHANATLGRALRLILQNIGGALPGEMDRSTHGQPGKYTFCCAENEDMNPWEPLHVERGFARAASTVTAVGAGGTLNNTILTQHADDLLRVIADTMAHPSSNDYWFGGAPWLVFSPEHAAVLNRAGLSKAEVKRRLWHDSKMAAGRMAREDLVRTQAARVSELGEIGPDTMLPVSPTPDEIGIIVAGGAGTHTVYVPSFGPTGAVTREIVFAA